MLNQMLAILPFFILLWSTSHGRGIFQLFVERKGNNSWIVHRLPPPARSTDVVEFSPVFDKHFLKEVLAFKQKVMDLSTGGSSPVSLEDICLMLEGKCLVDSVWSYFQDTEENIDKEAWDQWHFFLTGNYLDHLQACFWEPWIQHHSTGLNMSCLSDTGWITSARYVYDLPNQDKFACAAFPNSTRLVISLYLWDSPQSDNSVSAWWQTVQDYVTSALPSAFPNMTVTLRPPALKQSSDFLVQR